MKIFLSWSGEISRQIADALRVWLGDVLQDVQPWMSEHDIAAGSRWSANIDQELSESNFGILCLTSDNLAASWLLFEAGSLAKDPTLAQVVPYHFKISAKQVGPPLSQFQGVDADEAGTLKLIQTINQTRETPLESGRLLRQFKKWWPDLAKRLANITEKSALGEIAIRSDREILEELLGLVRETRSEFARVWQDLRSFIPSRADMIWAAQVPEDKITNLSNTELRLYIKLGELKLESGEAIYREADWIEERIEIARKELARRKATP